MNLMRACIQVCIYVCMYVFKDVHMSKCMCVHMYKWVQVHTGTGED